MHRVLLCLFIALSLNSQGMNVSFNHGIFMTPESGFYVETYLLFDAEELRFGKQSDGTFQQNVELTYIFEQQGKLAGFSKTAIAGPVTNDTTLLSDFIDQQRFALKPGTYELFISLRDLNNPSDSVKTVQKIEVREGANGVFFSSIYLASRAEKTNTPNVYSRSGMDYYPRVSPYFPPAANELFFYAELYGMTAGEPFLINLDLVDARTNEALPNYHQSLRISGKAVEVISRKIDISTLPTGTYTLRLEARNRENNLLAARQLDVKRFGHAPAADTNRAFDLTKTFVAQMTDDSLRKMCYCAVYASTVNEERYINENWKKGDIEHLRQFFYGFWYDRSPVDAQGEWLRYYERIKHVEREYRTSNAHGCATDRGRIYLKYGKPNSMSIVKNEAHASPYEIWHYFKIPEKSNAKFFFFDPKRTNDFELAHSNVLGETRDELWYTRLTALPAGIRSTAEHEQEALGHEIDNQSAGSRALDYWNNPR